MSKHNHYGQHSVCAACEAEAEANVTRNMTDDEKWAYRTRIYAPIAHPAGAMFLGKPLIGNSQSDEHKRMHSERIDHYIEYPRRPGGINDHTVEYRYFADGRYEIYEEWPGLSPRLIARMWPEAIAPAELAYVDKIIRN